MSLWRTLPTSMLDTSRSVPNHPPTHPLLSIPCLLFFSSSSHPPTHPPTYLPSTHSTHQTQQEEIQPPAAGRGEGGEGEEKGKEKEETEEKKKEVGEGGEGGGGGGIYAPAVLVSLVMAACHSVSRLDEEDDALNR